MNEETGNPIENSRSTQKYTKTGTKTKKTIINNIVVTGQI
jgi:hypothetical protein